MKTSNFSRNLAFGLVLFASSSVWAGDNIQVTVSGGAGPEPVLKLNGNEAIQGTVQLFYVVEAYSFPVGPFASFMVDMNAVHLNGALNAVYPAPLTLSQNGSSNLILNPVPSSFSVLGLGEVGTTEVSISIPSGVPNADGTDLVGNLNLAIPGTNKIGTPTSVQVHIRLSHPGGCLKVFDFITDTDLETTYESMTVNVNTNKGWVSSTHPSQISDNVLIANTCSWDEAFDLQIGLDRRFDTNPNGNPGNAIHTYDSAGIVEASDFDIDAFGAGTGQGQNLCLQSVSVPAGTSFLAAVHSALINRLPLSELQPSPFVFGAKLTAPGTACGGQLIYSLDANPLTLEVPFVVN